MTERIGSYDGESSGQLPPACMLSDEIYLQIFERLSCRELARVAQVCRNWRQIAYDKSLWRLLAEKLGLPPQEAHVRRRTRDAVQGKGWKQAFSYDLLNIVLKAVGGNEAFLRLPRLAPPILDLWAFRILSSHRSLNKFAFGEVERPFSWNVFCEEQHNVNFSLKGVMAFRYYDTYDGNSPQLDVIYCLETRGAIKWKAVSTAPHDGRIAGLFLAFQRGSYKADYVTDYLRRLLTGRTHCGTTLF